MQKTTSLILALLLSASSHAEESLSEQADSLDFESFHRKDNGKNLTEEVISKREKTPAISSTAKAPDGDSLVSRQLFSVTGDSPLQSPSSARDAAYREMSVHCGNGWIKQREWAVLHEGDWQLHIEFRCL